MKTIRVGLSAFALCALVVLSGCTFGSVGHIVSTPKIYNGTDRMEIAPATKVDPLDVAIEVGKELGYTVAGVDKVSGMVTLVSASSLAKGVFLGSSSHVTIMIRRNGGALDFMIMNRGNFGAGTQESSEKMLTELKGKISLKLSGGLASK